MNVKTRYFGEIDIQESDVIRFPEGILGFPDSRSFALITIEENPYLKALQDIENEHLSFLVIRPWDSLKITKQILLTGIWRRSASLRRIWRI